MSARQRTIGRAVALFVFCAPALLACGNGADGGDASCAAPYLNDEPPGGEFRVSAATVGPAETLRIYGHWYTYTCNDTGEHAPHEPLGPVALTLRLPGGEEVSLGRFTPHGHDLGFRADVEIPRQAEPGIATIQDDRTPPATYRFRVRATS